MRTNATISAMSFGLLVGALIAVPASAQSSPQAALDAFYKAAAAANESEFIAVLAADAVLLGIGDEGRLQGQPLYEYVSESFASGGNWRYSVNDRQIRQTDDGSVAWFDESLQSDGLSPGRASGVLVQDDGNWKVAQYNLTVSQPAIAPVPPSQVPAAAASTEVNSAPQKPECRQLRHKTNKKSSC